MSHDKCLSPTGMIIWLIPFDQTIKNKQLKKVILIMLLMFYLFAARTQTVKTELYDFVKKLLYDSPGYKNVSESAVGL